MKWGKPNASGPSPPPLNYDEYNTMKDREIDY